MFGAKPSKLPQEIAFLLVPNFSMIAFTSAIEPLRLANRASGKELYRWRLFSPDSKSVRASNGIELAPEGSIDQIGGYQTVVLCSGIDGHLYEDKNVFAALRRADRQGADIGALCTGSHILARANMLNGYRCTIHWENLASFSENFPEIEATSELFEVDRNRFTCSGGTAALDMMLNMISQQHGHELAASVSEQFIHERIRDRHDHQRMALTARLGVRHPKLIQVIQLMEQNPGGAAEPPGAGGGGRPLQPADGAAVRQVSPPFAGALLRGAAPQPRAPAAAANQYVGDRHRARLRVRVGVAFLEVLSRFLWQDTAPRARGTERRAGRRNGEEKRGGPGLTGIHRHFI